MNFFDTRMKEKILASPCAQKHKSKMWHKITSVMLCIALLSTTMLGALADDIPISLNVGTEQTGNPSGGTDPEPAGGTDPEPPGGTDPEQSEGTCPHHLAHNEECGYTEDNPVCNFVCTVCPVQQQMNDVLTRIKELENLTPEEKEHLITDIKTALAAYEALDAEHQAGISVEIPAETSLVAWLTETLKQLEMPETSAQSIAAWTWVDEEEHLTEYNGEWYLSLPDADMQELTEERLKAMLPKQIRVMLSNGEEKLLDITWTFSELSKGSYRLDAALGEGYTWAEGVKAPCVLISFGNVTGWTWVDEEEYLTEYNGQWYLSLPGANMQELTEEMLREILQEMLPKQIRATLANNTEKSDDTQQPSDSEQLDGIEQLNEIQQPNAPEQSNEPEQSYGTQRPNAPEQPKEEALLDITWDFSALQEEPQVVDISENTQQVFYLLKASLGEDYALAKDVPPLEVRLDIGGAGLYDFPGNRTPILADKLDEELRKHQVQGITPAGTTVNLFNYDPQIKAYPDGRDLLPDGATFENYSNGINSGALLLFGGSAMREAGFWNQGSGAGRPWGKIHTNMKGIVRSKLENGYPYINLEHARDKLEDATGTASDNWGTGEFMDVANLNHAEYENAGVDKARALSTKLLESRSLMVNGDGPVTGNCEKASLKYLFDPDTTTYGKESYKNVTGLFQVDKDGYYYYDARKNFAEFQGNKTSDSDGSFVLYDGPAVWRTDAGYNPGTNAFDGDMSLGNFYPFNTGKEVFDSIDDKGCLSSSDTGFTSWNKQPFKNQATQDPVLIDHYMGMTMQVDFTQPEDGKLNMGSAGKKPMIFQFSGDDDVWIFIDDVLVLDLGGVHSELYGTIDFSTGEIITGQSWRTGGLPENPGSVPHDETTNLYDCFAEALGEEEVNTRGWATSSSGERIFPTGTEHTLKLFYLERGNYDSSLQMRFNLQSQLYHSIKKVDQNGDPLEGVEFELYAAVAQNSDSPLADDYKTKGNVIGTLTTDKDGKSDFVREDGSPFSFTDRYHEDGTLYYILKETKTAGGYRTLPKDIVLRFDPKTSMLVVVNRYETGAYASFFSNINETGSLTYGQFDTGSGNIASSNTELSQDSKQNGIIVAVPMLFEKSNQKWNCLYGSNTEGYGAVAPAARTAEAWREAVLKAALYQASDERWPEWRLTYNQSTGKLEGLLEDLPGRSDRYVLNNQNGDMKMVYGIIEPSALNKLGITGNTSEQLYNALETYVSEQVSDETEGAEAAINKIVGKLNITGNDFAARDFSFLNTDQFQREFRSSIYIPNERRELRVWKVDENGKGVNGVTFTLYGSDGNEVATGTTATVDGRDGVLIFRPDGGTGSGYAKVTWGDIGTKYTLKETSAPYGYEKNETEIPVVVGIYSIYADAGKQDDGVTVMAGVGKLMQTMTKYAADDMVNITLRDITAIAQTQKTGQFKMDGWKDDFLKDTSIPRSMNLHYGINAMVDYGLHNEDGGKNIYPVFTTDEGFLRARVEQNTDALRENLYEFSNNTANWDNLRGRHLTSLFSLLNTVVVTDKKITPENTGKLRVSKMVSGTGLQDSDYTHNFTFKVSLKTADGTSLPGKYYYYGEQRAGYISDGGTLSLRHDEALTILGLPIGTQWEISEQLEPNWSVSPQSGIISGTVQKDDVAIAAFTNYKGKLPDRPLTVYKIVDGNAGDKHKEFHFTVTLSDKTISGTYGNMEFTQGVANFTLKHGEQKTAVALPAGIGYTVAEAEADQDGYTTTATNANGKITDAVMVTFTNIKNVTPEKPEEPEKPETPRKPEKPERPTPKQKPETDLEPESETDLELESEPETKPKKKVPNTGDESNVIPCLILLAVSGLGIVSILFISKRKPKDTK